MIKKIISTLILFKSVMGNNPHYGNEQIIMMLEEFFKESKNSPALFGHHFYKNKNEMVFQVEIETDAKNVNDAMIFSFKIISKLANISKTNFTHSIVVMHFKINALPIIAKTELSCSKKYFIDKKQNEIQWRKNCLSIQNN